MSDNETLPVRGIFPESSSRKSSGSSRGEPNAAHSIVAKEDIPIYKIDFDTSWIVESHPQASTFTQDTAPFQKQYDNSTRVAYTVEFTDSTQKVVLPASEQNLYNVTSNDESSSHSHTGKSSSTYATRSYASVSTATSKGSNLNKELDGTSNKNGGNVEGKGGRESGQKQGLENKACVEQDSSASSPHSEPKDNSKRLSGFLSRHWKWHSKKSGTKQHTTAPDNGSATPQPRRNRFSLERLVSSEPKSNRKDGTNDLSPSKSTVVQDDTLPPTPIKGPRKTQSPGKLRKSDASLQSTMNAQSHGTHPSSEPLLDDNHLPITDPDTLPPMPSDIPRKDTNTRSALHSSAQPFPSQRRQSSPQFPSWAPAMRGSPANMSVQSRTSPGTILTTSSFAEGDAPATMPRRFSAYSTYSPPQPMINDQQLTYSPAPQAH